MTEAIRQTPAEKLIYKVDWPARGIGANTIVTSVFTPSSADFTLSDEAITDDSTTTVFTLTGGIATNFYYIVNKITLSSGEIMEEYIPYVCLYERII